MYVGTYVRPYIAASSADHSYCTPPLPPCAPIVLLSFIKTKYAQQWDHHLSDTNRWREGKGGAQATHIIVQLLCMELWQSTLGLPSPSLSCTNAYVNSTGVYDERKRGRQGGGREEGGMVMQYNWPCVLTPSFRISLQLGWNLGANNNQHTSLIPRLKATNAQALQLPTIHTHSSSSCHCGIRISLRITRHPWVWVQRRRVNQELRSGT